ncbi:MAG: purine-binding chemotaxis protein CheW [Candidatus Thermoplasmatota archaeon]|nr:purine-binding chemotaxis protein CheW [Candidatus Thermoplasmatota archaeon]
MPGPELQQYVVFRLGDEEYAFDIAAVKEIRDLEQVAKVHRSPSFIEGVMNLRGKLVTIVDLRKRLSIEARAPDASSKIIVIEAPDAPVGFLVDEVTEVVKVGDGDIEAAPAYVADGLEAEYVKGIAKMGERLITIVDPVKILDLSTDDGETRGG